MFPLSCAHARPRTSFATVAQINAHAKKKLVGKPFDLIFAKIVQKKVAMLGQPAIELISL